MYVTVQTEKSTPIWTIRAAICDGHLPQRLFNKYEKQSAKLVNALADRKLTNIEAQRVVRILEVRYNNIWPCLLFPGRDQMVNL